ncbi:MAG: adenosine deaminase [Lachnospiraceae bacterium]|jgi:adenosine deaminase|nr:adenosine deaminase [Lachnospiraceae bacterium]
MIDLHLHLDGSLPPALLIRLAELEGVLLPSNNLNELAPYISVPKNCRSLNEFLQKFDLPVSCMQSEQTLKEAAWGLVKELADQGLRYAEIRFAPQLHQRKGLTQKQAVEAVISGMEAGKEERDLKTGLILCCMRGKDNEKENMETIRLAALFLGKGVCGADLAGAEALYPTKDYESLFASARENHVPITIHAGEADGPDSVRAALAMGASRIGHGVRGAEDPKLMQEIIDKQITLEICVTSNYQTKAVLEGQIHPILKLLRQGAAVTVNTDDMTVCNTTLADEFEYLRKKGMTKEEEMRLLLNGAEGAFLSEEEKQELKTEILSRFKK